MSTSELDSNRWAVISFARCEADGLTYSQAAAKMRELDELRIAGLCLVTQETAERVKA